MKSPISNMLKIWCAATYDAAHACANSDVELARDRARATSISHSRGLGFFTLDLPSLDVHLLNLLEYGECKFEGPLTARRSKRDQRPTFLWGLWSRVCDANGCLLPEADLHIDAIVYLRQLSCLFKKYETPCSPQRVLDAVKEYKEIENEIRQPTLSWDCDSLGTDSDLRIIFGDLDNFDDGAGDLFDLPPRSLSYRDRDFLGRLQVVCDILSTNLGLFDSMSVDTIREGIFKHGPGAVSNLPKNKYKYSFPNWSEKLEGVFPYDWCSGDSLGSYPASRNENPAKLLAVPKTSKGPRLIAAEPIEHQWCQQKIATWLDNAFQQGIVGNFVDLHNQGLSQAMVASASIDRSLSTIDLSSASDRVSCWHIERLLRRNIPLLEACHAVRSRYVREAVTNSGFIRLKKFAAMGSALTFPVQCLFFLSIALASAGATDVKSILALRGKVRVFGDDIIIPNTAHARCVHNLSLLGLKVNSSKSFSLGYFRESCGADFYRGFDVTPAKPKHVLTDTLVSTQSVLDTSNNLFQKGHWHASQATDALLPRFLVKNISKPGDGVPTLYSFSGRRFCRISYDKNLQRKVIILPFITKVTKRVGLDTSDMLREFFTRKWDPLRPRLLGISRSGVAKLATLRVDYSSISFLN